MENKTWRDVQVRSGRYNGQSMVWVYVNDPMYLYEISNGPDFYGDEAAQAASKAIEYKNRVDPFSEF